ncbi:hypothetical protein C1645_872473 [Glomus cerebriforme]|uniref:SAM domain-containing protein n=1 Tax=Glomus cerebriforme TaxID=658196 RepID=A0A397TC36_9GLOM|nr:hypothetical protein C1645_872473 [Glomus cerebriforme]
MSSYISFITIYRTSTVLLKSLPNIATKLITLSSPFSHFIKINSLTTNSHIQSSVPLSRRHYNTIESTNNSDDNINKTSGFINYIRYYLNDDKLSLDNFDLEGINPRKKKSLKTKIWQVNKKRSFIKENIVETNFEALNDFKEWLRRLRFKKWAPVFEGMKWQDIIQLNDEQLLEKGITTYSVRMELLYYFNIIKKAKAERDAQVETPDK